MPHVARGVALLLCLARLTAAGQQSFQGLRLDEALRLLQRNGLQLVYSSEIVTPSMRVVSEPRATAPRKQLDELLQPHGLRAEAGPGRVILIVRDRPSADHSASKPAQPVTRKSGTQGTTAYVDRIVVRGSRSEPMDLGVSETTFDRNALRAAGSILDGDGLQAIHEMPRVAAVDDFRSEFSVRGSPYRHIGIVIDGVATPWLQHSVYGRKDAGSLSMFGSDILDGATLQAGAYPRRYGDALGAQLELRLKEGSRESTRLAATAGGTSGAFVGEGPIGSEGRGSWIAGVRNSYRTWPARRFSTGDVGFAFVDAHAKLVYDVSPSQQVSLTALGGRSALDGADEPYVSVLGNGTNQAALLIAGWRSTLGSDTIIVQRVSLVGQELSSTMPGGQLAGRSANRALEYRGKALHGLFGGLLEAGAEVSRLSGARDIRVDGLDAPGQSRDAFRATWTTRSAYANYAHAAPRGLSFEVGARASGSALVHQRALTPWILGAWRFRPGWTMNASAGASRQFPELDAVLGQAGSSSLVPEHATHVDVGVEQRLSSGLTWQVTLFDRIENDVLRGPDVEPKLQGGVIVIPSIAERYGNSLHGAARGIELVVTPESADRLSGWMSYTYGIARQNDTKTRETFWSDVDRRHALSASGVFRVGPQSSVRVALRAASGVPIPGYFHVDNGKLVVGERRNAVRLAPYVRLDARAQRTFFSSRHPVTVFGELLNALDRHNQGIADGFVQPVTGEAVGFSRSLMPRRVSIGIAVDLVR
jgi:hypothetical protein